MPIPEQLNAIADSVKAGTPRRLKVRTLFGYYGLHRRRDAGIAALEPCWLTAQSRTLAV